MNSNVPAHDHGLTDPVDGLAPAWLRPLLELVDRRAGMRVDDDGIHVRQLLRTRHVPWDEIATVQLDSRLDAVLASVTRFVPLGRIPVVGGWLVDTSQELVSSVTRRLTPGVRDDAGWTVATIERSGLLRSDVEVDGGAHLTALCRPGLAETVVSHARMRHIPVDRA